MRFLDLFRSNQKLWRVGDHRVKSYNVKIRGTEVHGDTTGATASTKTKYECIDCEKKYYSRPAFEDESCYEVIGDE